MTVAKTFRFEAAHRLPWHQGGCRNLHGHSYVMTVELAGEPDGRGMVIDFKEIKAVLKPLVDALDHGTIVAEDDAALMSALDDLDSKRFVLPYDTTSENLCRFVADHLRTQAQDLLASHRITKIRVRIQETDSCYAEVERQVGVYRPLAPRETETLIA
jgi:6-pyruvoyltetrahydropterin/6-carboxytetrahydropterin synthase